MVGSVEFYNCDKIQSNINVTYVFKSPMEQIDKTSILTPNTKRAT